MKTSLLAAPYRWLLMLAAFACLALGFIGIWVPGLPTTVFVLLAAWLAARSSPALAQWLDNHRITGPMIHHWRTSRSVPRQAKYAATAGMSLSVIIMLITNMNLWIMAPLVVFMLAVLIWLWLLPEPSGNSVK
ncbi:YbaN family protein [Alteromonas sp. C1M14]|uniref:YbaN family protein n=1 Tax=Alteromonas sp. C1M14 TaxID=2841567 RepID=UPI001C091D64|nr:YbaN family protein [Alteromonas sp. C1M14]MBU2980003.1 YbaN family protein [Alteromonas sp. C1M14]